MSFVGEKTGNGREAVGLEQAERVVHDDEIDDCRVAAACLAANEMKAKKL